MGAFQCSACNFTTFEIQHLLQHVCVGASGKLMAFLFQSLTRLLFEERSKHSDFLNAVLRSSLRLFFSSIAPTTVDSSILHYEETVPAAAGFFVSLERWEDKHVRLLITVYGEFEHLFPKGKTTKKDIFAKIAAAFNEKSIEKVMADQCMRKWSKLEMKLKDVDDHNEMTGRVRKSWKFHREMTACMGSSPKKNPAVTIDTSSIGATASGSSSSSSCSKTDSTGHDGSDADSSEEAAGPRAKKAKFPARKRKSKFSAAEMLSFLQSYTERREKVDAEKLELLRSMKNEKKEILLGGVPGPHVNQY